MGQIVIDIPNKTSRRYNVEQAEQARKLLQFLDHLLPKNGAPAELTREQIQDLKDGMESDLALAEMRRTGEKYSLDQIREELGLS